MAKGGYEMLKARIIIWAALLVLGMTGVVSASAFAEPVWVVKGGVLKSSEIAKATIKFGKLKMTWEDKVAKTKFEAECKKATGEAELKGGEPGTDQLQSFKFKECALPEAVETATGCELTIGGVTAEELPGWSTKLEPSIEKTYDTVSGISFGLILEGC